MKKFLVSYYFRKRGAMSRLGGSSGDRTGYCNKVWEGENLPQNDEEILTLEKDIAKSIQAIYIVILSISPLQ